MLARFLLCAALVSAAAALAPAAPALAANAHNWQIGFQEPASSMMEGIVSFHNLVQYIITAITLFVLALLVIVVVKFNARANPTPTRTTHNTAIEVAWTLIPVLILVAIAVPSFRLLFEQTNVPPADLTVKATGKQWFWSYNYPDQGNFEFDSIMIPEKDLKPGQSRLQSVDNPLVVPVNKVVRLQMTGADVIHAWAVPSLGVAMDAVPGRLNEMWFKSTKEGVFYGNCRELCGRDHAFMPVEVHVVSEQAFNAWLDEAKKRFASNSQQTPRTLAAAQ